LGPYCKLKGPLSTYSYRYQLCGAWERSPTIIRGPGTAFPRVPPYFNHWFNRIRQVAPVYTPSSTLQSASAPYRCWPLLSCFEVSTIRHVRACPGRPPCPQNYPFTCGDLDPCNAWFPGYSQLKSQVHNPNDIAIGLAVFLHSSRQRVPIFHNGPPLFPLKIAPSHGGSGPASNTWFLWPTRVNIANCIFCLAAFAGLTIVTD